MNRQYINRPIYTERIKPFIGKQLIKVLIGQRRVGKSYILIQLMDVIKQMDPQAHIIHVDKELLSFVDIKDSIALYNHVCSHLSDSDTNYLFIDEVQEIADF